MINILLFDNCTGYTVDLVIHIYYSGAPRRAGAPRHICHFIPYYIIIILFKRQIMNLVNNELQFMNNIGYVINLNIRIYYGGAPRPSGAPRHVCHFILYYIIIIPFKTYIINSIIHTLQFMNNIGYVVNLNIRIYYSGAPR